MELWATGFNAWNQLQFDGELPAQPRDLQEFTLLLKDEQIELLRTFLSATLVRTPSGLGVAGYVDGWMKFCSEAEDGLQSVAIAGNDKIAEFIGTTVIQYNSFHTYIEKQGTIVEGLEEIKQLTANQTTFTALSTNGLVYTWGDGRFEACLGREVTDENPASKTCIVDGLSELPDKVLKISSGGYITAALTESNDIYIWGRTGYPELSEPVTGSPTPLDMDSMDFLDIAVGMNHMIVLTVERKVFVVGAGWNGQLGLGSAVQESKDWKEVNLPLKEGQQVASVFAGYKNSFMIIENAT